MTANPPDQPPSAPEASPRPPVGAEPDLIPVRALNQVSYCPRLYYLEYVEAVMPINEYVEDGLFQHRRVNDPDLANRTRKEGDALRTRSVSLSSQNLGITAKLDLLEEQGDAIRPVETKRSAAPKDDDGQPSYWENDAIQLCAQGLLAEESMGVTVHEGVIYYVGSKARVTVPFNESLRQRTLEAMALVRDVAQSDVPPEPLPPELRHSCFGCSLAPICLPEETLYLIHQPDSGLQAGAADPSTSPHSSTPLTRVIAKNDDKAVLYVQDPGAHIGRRSEHLVVSLRGQEVRRVPIVSVRQVVIFGNVQVSTQALQTLTEAEVAIVFLTRALDQGLLFGRLHGRLRPLSRLLSHGSPRPALAGARSDGGVPAGDRRLGRLELDQQWHADRRRLSDLARRLLAHRRRPQDVF